MIQHGTRGNHSAAQNTKRKTQKDSFLFFCGEWEKKMPPRKRKALEDLALDSDVEPDDDDDEEEVQDKAQEARRELLFYWKHLLEFIILPDIGRNQRHLTGVVTGATTQTASSDAIYTAVRGIKAKRHDRAVVDLTRRRPAPGASSSSHRRDPPGSQQRKRARR